jgi:hypothetical protein
MRFSLVRWILCNWFAGLIGTVLIFTAFQPASIVQSALIPGLLLGTAQALAIDWRRATAGRYSRMLAWTAVVTLGFLIQGFVGILLQQWTFIALDFRYSSMMAFPMMPLLLLSGSLGAALTGGLVGLAQGMLLRADRPGFTQVRPWMLASAAGWLLSYVALNGGTLLFVSFIDDDAGGGAVTLALAALLLFTGWALYALVTGPLLAVRPGATPSPDSAELPVAP